jgi:hypothetical protein
MPADIVVAQNRPNLNTIKAAKATADGGTNQPRAGQGGKANFVTKTGDASWTTIIVTHNLGSIPSNVQFSATSQAAAAICWENKAARTTTQFTIVFAAAPANAAVASFDYVVYP